MTVSRRGFFKLAAGAAAMVAVPSVLISEHVPTIYCDGVNCDAAGLAALMAGKAVQFAASDMAGKIGWAGGTLNLSGDFLILEPVIAPDQMSGKVLSGGRYNLHSSFLDLTGVTGVTVTGCEIDITNCPPGCHGIKDTKGNGFESVYFGVT